MSLKCFVPIEEIQKIKTFLLIFKTKKNILSNIEEDILILISKRFVFINEYKNIDKLYLNDKLPFYQNKYKIYNLITNDFDNLSYETQDELKWENNRYIKKKSLYKIFLILIIDIENIIHYINDYLKLKNLEFVINEIDNTKISIFIFGYENENIIIIKNLPNELNNQIPFLKLLRVLGCNNIHIKLIELFEKHKEKTLYFDSEIIKEYCFGNAVRTKSQSKIYYLESNKQNIILENDKIISFVSLEDYDSSGSYYDDY